MSEAGTTTVIEIKIRRVILDGGGMAVQLVTPADGYSAVEILGMLEVVKGQIYADMASGDYA